MLVSDYNRLDTQNRNNGSTVIDKGDNTMLEVGNIGSWLKETRKEKRITLREASDAVGCSASYLHRLENNSRKNPSINILKKLAFFYEVDIQDILSEDQHASEQEIQLFDQKEELENAINHMKTALSIVSERSNLGEESQSLDIEELRRHLREAQKALLFATSNG